MTTEEPPSIEFVAVEVTGDSVDLWRRLRPKLIDAVSRLLDTIVNEQTGASVRDEVKNLSAALIAHTKERLAKAGLENDKIEAEVQRTYAEIENMHAVARKINAEATAIELQNSIRQLRLVLGGTKALLLGEQGHEAIVLSQQIDGFLSVLREISPS